VAQIKGALEQMRARDENRVIKGVKKGRKAKEPGRGRKNSEGSGSGSETDEGSWDGYWSEGESEGESDREELVLAATRRSSRKGGRQPEASEALDSAGQGVRRLIKRGAS
jgi:hypothetical protein